MKTAQASESEYLLKALQPGEFVPPHVAQQHEHRYQLRYWVAYRLGVPVAWCALEVTPGGYGLCWYDHAPVDDDQNLAEMLFHMRLTHAGAINCIGMYRAPDSVWGPLYTAAGIR